MFLFKQEALNTLRSWGQAAHEGHLAGVMSWAELWCCFGQHFWRSTTVRPRYIPGKEESSAHCLELNLVTAVISFLPAEWEHGQQVKPICDLIYERKGIRRDSTKMRRLHDFTIFPWCLHVLQRTAGRVQSPPEFYGEQEEMKKIL